MRVPRAGLAWYQHFHPPPRGPWPAPSVALVLCEVLQGPGWATCGFSRCTTGSPPVGCMVCVGSGAKRGLITRKMLLQGSSWGQRTAVTSDPLASNKNLKIKSLASHRHEWALHGKSTSLATAVPMVREAQAVPPVALEPFSCWSAFSAGWTKSAQNHLSVFFVRIPPSQHLFHFQTSRKFCTTQVPLGETKPRVRWPLSTYTSPKHRLGPLTFYHKWIFTLVEERHPVPL